MFHNKRALNSVTSLVMVSVMLLFSGCTAISEWLITDHDPKVAPENARILAKGRASVGAMKEFLESNNERLNPAYVDELVSLYIQESNREGVNYDVAFVQMCHETAFLKFGNQVNAKQNNFAGIGAVDGGGEGARFRSPRIGVRAQVQHLLAYASTRKPRTKLVDPRFYKVKNRGSARTFYDLAGTWASDLEYGLKLEAKMGELYKIENRRKGILPSLGT